MGRIPSDSQVHLPCLMGEQTEAQGGWRFAEEAIKAGWGQSGKLKTESWTPDPQGNIPIGWIN